MKLDILAFGAHPDDVEIGCAGTIAKEVSFGKKVGIVDLTQGELGTRGNAPLRLQEAEEARKIQGALLRDNLGFRDGFFTNDEAHLMPIIKKIREYQPEIVICTAIDDRHIDHGKGSKLVSDACFLSGLRRIETSVDGVAQAAWRPKYVYHYIQWKNIVPDFVVDITGFIDVKLAAVLAYKSQFYDENSKDPDTPISSKMFLDSISYRAKDFGRLIGTDFAEGFTCERVPAVKSVFDLI